MLSRARCRVPARRYSTTHRPSAPSRPALYITHDQKNPRVCIAVINRPTKLNALNQQVGDLLKKEIAALRNNKDVRALVVTGEGHYFSSGGDLSFLLERSKDTFENNVSTMLGFYSSFMSIRTLPFPVISAMNGNAIGAGMCLASVTDIRVAADSGKYSFNFVRLGMGPGFGVTHILPRLIGQQAANHLLMTGATITGSEAAAIGLVKHAVPAASVLETSLEIARQIAVSSPTSVKFMTELLRRPMEVGVEETLKKEAESQAHCFASKEFQEGVAAIKEKRKPNF